MYASSPSFTTESNQALPAALYSLTYLVRAGGSCSSGFLVVGWVGSLVGAWVGSSVGASLLVDLQELGQCVVWWGWDLVGFPQEGPLLLLQPVLTVYPWTYLHLVYLPLATVWHLPALMGGPLRCLPLGHL